MLASLIEIGYGIFVEKYYVAWFSVVYNVLLTVLLLSSVNLPWQILVILVLFVIAGFLAADAEEHEVFFLFGAKSFGSLSLAVSLIPMGATGLGWTDSILGVISPGNVGNEAAQVVAAWAVFAIVAHVLGYIVVERSE